MSDHTKALIVSGYGINCERETALAVKRAEGEATIVHLEKVFQSPEILDEMDWVIVPGGFSFGDELGAGRVLANKLLFHKNSLGARLRRLVDEGGGILGICNGCQFLVNMGLIPGGEEPQVSLQENEQGEFVNRWCEMKVQVSPCVYTRGLSSFSLPVRHGEGRFTFSSENQAEELMKKGQVPLVYAETSYPENPNGSPLGIAGLCDETGRILGLMPHPEAYTFPQLHPFWHQQKGRQSLKEAEGLIMFQNGVRQLKRKKKALVNH